MPCRRLARPVADVGFYKGILAEQKRSQTPAAMIAHFAQSSAGRPPLGRIDRDAPESRATATRDCHDVARVLRHHATMLKWIVYRTQAVVNDLMTRIVVDALLREKLQDLSAPLELCNDDGRVLARLMPVYDPEKYGPLEPPIGEEELARREASSERRYRTEEVLRHLATL